MVCYVARRQLGWAKRSADMVQLLAVWLGNFCHYPTRLDASISPKETRHVLNEIYRLAGIRFPFDADLNYIRSVVRQANSLGEGLNHLDAAQVRDVYTKAARIVAGVLMQVTAGKLAFRAHSVPVALPSTPP
jgi:hypothetical protein